MTDEYMNEQDDIELEACLWIAKIDGGSLSAADLTELKRWIKADPRHRAAFETYSTDFLIVDDILSTVGEAISDLEAPLTKAKASHSAAAFRPIFTKRNYAYGSFALVCAFIAILAVTFYPRAPFEQTEQLHMATHTVLQKSAILPDGSSVQINAGSEIRVFFSKTKREVILEHGEAVFDVVKDPSRPFTVRSGDTVVTAIGTIFSVKSIDDAIEVMVEEGVVELYTPSHINQATKPDASAGQSLDRLRIAQGDSTHVSKTAGIKQRKADFDYIERRLSWRDGFLSFEQDSLSDVVMEVNRYSSNKITIADSALANLKIGGVFPIERTEAFLDALENGFGVKVSTTDKGVIELTKKE